MTVDVQILAPPPFVGVAFVLGANKVGDPLSDSDPGLAWLSYLDESTGVEFARGGETPALNALDVGTLSLTVPDADPTAAGFRPGRQVRAGSYLDARVLAIPVTDERIRLSTAVGTADQFYYAYAETVGATVTVSTTEDGTTTLASSSGEMVLRVRVPSIGEQIALYGQAAATAATLARFKVRAAQPLTVTATGPVDFTKINAAPAVNTWGTAEASGPPRNDRDFVQFVLAGAEGVPLSVEVDADASGLVLSLDAGFGALWGGTITDVLATDRKRGRVPVSVQATDAVTAVANTTVPTLTAASGGDTFLQRATKLAAFSPLPLEVTDDYLLAPKRVGGNGPSDWTFWGTLPANSARQPLANRQAGDLLGVLYRVDNTATTTLSPRQGGMQTVLSGLVVGRRYSVTVRARLDATLSTGGDITDLYNIGVEGIGWSKLLRLSRTATSTLAYEFTATASAHTLRVASGESVNRGAGVLEAVVIGDGSIGDLSADAFTFAGTGTEMSLADALNLLCDSVGGLWRTTPRNTIDVRRYIRPVVRAQFSDEPDAEPSYTDLTMTYSTADVINVLDVTNLGRDSAGSAADVASTHTNTTSATSWGPRRRQVNLNLFTAAQVTERAAQILTERAEPQRVPTSLTYRAEDVPDVIEVHDAVIVTRHGIDHLCLVVGVKHDLDHRRHRVTLTLRQL